VFSIHGKGNSAVQKAAFGSDRKSIGDMQIKGNATGSFFYPHGGLGTGGVSIGKYGNVQSVKN